MKKVFYTLAIAALAFVGCSEGGVEGDITLEGGESNTKALSVAVSASATADTRVSLTDDNDGGYIASWKSDDELGAWSDEVYGATSLPTFTISNYGSETSTFEGTVSDYAETIRFVHPNPTATFYAKDNTNAENSTYNTWYNAFDINMSYQVAQADLAHLSSTTYMVSDTYTVGNGTIPTMYHLGAVVDLRIKSTEAAAMELVSVTVDGEMIPTEVSVNLQKAIDEDYFETTSTGAITVEVPNFATDGDGVFAVSFNIFPFDVASGESIEVTAMFVDAEGTYYEGTTTISATEAVEFERATRNTIGALISESLTEVEVAETTTWTLTSEDFEAADDATGTSGYNLYNGTHTYDGVTYTTSQIMIGNSSLQMQASKGTIYNTSAMSNISEIVVTGGVHNGAATTFVELAVYAGATEQPSTALTAIQGTTTVDGVTVDTYTYKVASSSSYFMIEKNTTSAAYVGSIAVTYEGSGEGGGGTTEPEDPTAVFTGFNPSSLSFAYDATEAQSVAIEGENLDYATEMSIEIDDDTYFTISEIASDYTFTVAPKAENTSETAYTATVTVTIDGTSQTLEVSQLYDLPLAPGATISAIDILYAFNSDADYEETNTIGTSNKTVAIEVDDYIVSFAGSGTVAAYYYTSNTGNLRVYSGDVMTIESVDGGLITSIEIDYTGSGYAKMTSADSGEISTSGTTTTWSGSATSVSFTSTGTNRIVSFTINGGAETTEPEIEDEEETFDGTTLSITTASGTLSSYASSSNTYTGSMDFGGATFYNSDIYVYNTYVSMLLNGYSYNLTSFEGLSKLVITYQNTNVFDVYEGTEANPLSTKVTPSTDGTVYTYEITSGNTFFTLVRSTTSFVNATSIDVYYESLGATSEVPNGGTTEPETDTEGDTDSNSIVLTYESFLTATGSDAPATSSSLDLVDETIDFDGFSILASKGTGSTNFRLYNSSGTITIRSYAGNTITFTAEDGKSITSIEFTTSAISAASTGSYTSTTWTGDATSVTLTLAKVTENSITVTLAD